MSSEGRSPLAGDSWFNTPDRIAALEAEAVSWLRTPFVENGEVKGRKGAVSCHTLAAGIYRAVGFLPADFETPRGQVHKLTKSAPQAILDFVDADPSVAGRFANVIEDHIRPEQASEGERAEWADRLSEACLPGDLIALKHGGESENADVLKHLGIVLPQRRFVHVLRVIGVRISSLDDVTYTKHIAALRRPVLRSLGEGGPLP